MPMYLDYAGSVFLLGSPALLDKGDLLVTPAAMRHLVGRYEGELIRHSGQATVGHEHFPPVAQDKVGVLSQTRTERSGAFTGETRSLELKPGMAQKPAVSDLAFAFRPAADPSLVITLQKHDVIAAGRDCHQVGEDMCVFKAAIQIIADKDVLLVFSGETDLDRLLLKRRFGSPARGNLDRVIRVSDLFHQFCQGASAAVNIADDVDRALLFTDDRLIGSGDEIQCLRSCDNFDTAGCARRFGDIQHPGDHMIGYPGKWIAIGVSAVDLVFGDISEVDHIDAIAIIPSQIAKRAGVFFFEVGGIQNRRGTGFETGFQKVGDKLPRLLHLTLIDVHSTCRILDRGRHQKPDLIGRDRQRLQSVFADESGFSASCNPTGHEEQTCHM